MIFHFGEGRIGAAVKKQVLFGLSFAILSCVEDKKTEDLDIEDIIEETEEDTGEIEVLSLFYLAQNGVTVMCPEAEFGDSDTVNEVTYTKRDREELLHLVEDEMYSDVEKTCVSGITDMSLMFHYSDFNGDISTWDVSNVKSMSEILKDGFHFIKQLPLFVFPLVNSR